jgi:hypothetical protein
MRSLAVCYRLVWWVLPPRPAYVNALWGICGHFVNEFCRHVSPNLHPLRYMPHWHYLWCLVWHTNYETGWEIVMPFSLFLFLLTWFVQRWLTWTLPYKHHGIAHPLLCFAPDLVIWTQNVPLFALIIRCMDITNLWHKRNGFVLFLFPLPTSCLMYWT